MDSQHTCLPAEFRSDILCYPRCRERLDLAWESLVMNDARVYCGDEQQQHLARRTAALWNTLKTDVRFICHGRIIALSYARGGDLVTLQFLVELVGSCFRNRPDV